MHSRKKSNSIGNLGDAVSQGVLKLDISLLSNIDMISTNLNLQEIKASRLQASNSKYNTPRSN